MTREAKLRQLGLDLPPAPSPVGAYVAAVRTGNMIYTAGQLPMKEGRLVATGKVPSAVPLEAAQAAARQAALNALSAAVGALGEAGGLDRIARVVRMNVYVNSSEGFTDQAKVANAASELLAEVFGEAGRHTRCALGVAGLPLGAPVELDLIVEVFPVIAHKSLGRAGHGLKAPVGENEPPAAAPDYDSEDRRPGGGRGR